MKTAMLFILSILASYSSYPQGKDDMQMYVQIGHPHRIKKVAVSPDSRFILSGVEDGTIKLWDIRSGKELKSFNGHSNWVNCVIFSHDGNYALSASSDSTIILWNVKSGEKIHTLKGHTGKVHSVEFSHDDHYAASASDDMTIKLWDLNSGQEVKTFIGHKKEVFTAVFSPDGKYLLSGSGDDRMIMWDVKKGKKVLNLKPKYVEDGYISSVVFSVDGKYAISNWNDLGNHYLLLWDMKSGEQINDFGRHNSYLESVSYSSDGNYVVTASFDSTIVLWKISTGEKKRTLRGHKGWVNSACCTPDGKFIISCSDDASIKIWDYASGKCLRTLHSTSDMVSDAAISKDNKVLQGLHWDKTIKLWDLTLGREIRTFGGNKYLTESVWFSPDNKLAITEDFGYKIWDIASGKFLRDASGPISPSGKYFYSGLRSGSQSVLRLDDVTSGKRLVTYYVESEVEEVSISNDEKYILAGLKNYCIKVWNLQTGNSLWYYKLHNNMIEACMISPDNKYIASSSLDRTVKIMNTEPGTLKYTLKDFSSEVTSLSFSPDSKFLIMGTAYNTIELFDMGSGRIIKTFTGHTSRITSVEYAPDGTHFISSSWDHTTRIWNIPDNSWVAMVSGAGTNSGSWLIFTNDGYWDSSPDGGEMVAMVKGLECWNIDQFAIRNNRPDIILQRLGSPNKDMITHYYNQYIKRLRKLNMTEAQLSEDYHLPESKIINSVQYDKFIQLDIVLSDSNYNLKSYNIYVNDNPLYGAYGRPTGGKTFNISEKVELISGSNKIEVSCMNEKGAESYRELLYATYNGEAKGNLYFLAFGVSKYQNSSYNLQYADKDALDLEKVMQSFKGKGFENVYTKVLTNELVTPDAIKAAKDFVKNAKPDDTFVLFIAGHGLHDTDPEATYYFMTSNADLKNLKGTAADFETIEDLLQGIPPRNKLFLMDACESGEIDEEEQGQMMATATGAGINSRGFKVLQTPTSTGSVAGASPKRTYLYQKDRYIYNDLVRRSGAIVFSSCKGGELSYERSDIENGLFTEYIMKALTTNEADKDKNGFVSTDELRQYVSEQVAKASGDLQHPTVDRDNIYQKFGFQIK